ncbi:digalactosyldiacylglycerol synthase [Aureococcus anophagefferens]|nr:digalactosyldiacylglycerol synthase [Aureococcus anophagefferens]
MGCSTLLLLLAAARGWVPPLRCGPGSALGFARRRAPALDLRPLPPLAPSVEREFVTEDSDLSIKDRSVVIVTTASLPWMTGTAVNPALRAAYMAGGGYGDVTLMLPWMADGGDQTALFGACRFPEPAAQEAFVRAWIAENAPDAVGPDGSSSLKIGWYPARYAAGLGSILNLDDITSHIPRACDDVVILEEPEHLNWYRNGPRWTSRFRHVVGVAHTNYEAYATLESRDGRVGFDVLAERVFTETVTRAHCDVVVQLSAALRPLPHSRVANVHGVRKPFLDVGAVGGPPAFPPRGGDARCYFLGKAMWAKGYDQLLVFLGDGAADADARVDCYGGGPDLDDIVAKSKILGVGLDFRGPADHADANVFGAYDVFVNPSISEVLCTATAEALAMGKRVVIAKHPSNEFFYQFDGCHAVAPGDAASFPKELAAALAAAEDDRARYLPSSTPVRVVPDALRPLTWDAATERLVGAAALDARAPPARLALASLVMHSYHWGMTASPLALDLWLTISGAGPHTPWAEWRGQLFSNVGPGVSGEGDAKFERRLRSAIAKAAKGLGDANRLADVVADRVAKRETRSLVRHLGQRMAPRKRRKLPSALRTPAPRARGPRGDDAADDGVGLTEDLAEDASLFFEADEVSLAGDGGYFSEARWPRTARAWRRARRAARDGPASWLEPPSDARARDADLPKSSAAARATDALRRDLACSSVVRGDGGDDRDGRGAKDVSSPSRGS